MEPISLSRVFSPSLRMERCSWRSEIPRRGVDADDDNSSLTTRHLVAIDDRCSSCFKEITDNSRRASTCDKMRLCQHQVALLVPDASLLRFLVIQ